MSLLIRAALYLLCLFLVAIVYAGQKETTAPGTLRGAVRLTGKLFGWSVVGVVVMFGLEYLFID